VATEEEKFEEKFYQIKSRLGVTGSDNEIEAVIFRELRRDPNEDAGVLAFRIKGQLSCGA
jgi:hypothetical protein